MTSTGCWKKRKHLILAELVMGATTILTGIVLTGFSGTRGIGWDYDPTYPNYNIWQEADRHINFKFPFNYPTQILVTGPTPQSQA